MRLGTILGLWLAASGAVRAEGYGIPGGEFCGQTSVSYIDSAMPMSQIRFRFDSGSNLNRPNRAEYFWPKAGGTNRPFPESNVDYQDLSAYLEVACHQRFSVFFEAPFRWLDPEINPNTAGWSDLNAGVKLTLFETDRGVVTGQFRTYIPTGIGERGLGTDHVTFEPSLLWNRRLHDWVTLETEIRYWLPTGGSDFQGDMLRYGVGLVFGKQHLDCAWVTPVVEFIGWSPLSGRQSFLDGSGAVITQDARDENVVNTQVGLRMGVADCLDFYGGYGFRLTGDHWAEETWRLELRLKF